MAPSLSDTKTLSCLYDACALDSAAAQLTTEEQQEAHVELLERKPECLMLCHEAGLKIDAGAKD